MTTFYFYDLETSGINPRTQRIMQFAGQRTSLDLEPIGEPDDILIKLTPDILPEPEAILITGITPQRTQLEGVSEHEFLEHFEENIATADTIFIGFNTIRFDDEFMRFLHYRNLTDPYEWQWKDGRGRWDLLDVVRMTRALRPEGIKWPVGENGAKPNRLELITSLNGLEHTHAHNAMSDVIGSIEVAKLIKTMQPKLFSYLMSIRGKSSVVNLLSSRVPLVYTSGQYPAEYEKTTVIVPLGLDKEPGATLAFDLHTDPETWMNDEALRETEFPIKPVKHNKCPALAPLSVVDGASWSRIGLDPATVKNRAEFAFNNADKLIALYVPKYPRAEQSIAEIPMEKVDGSLYAGFISGSDKRQLDRIRKLPATELTDLEVTFEDLRLPGLLFLYRARQFPKSLLAEEREQWEKYLTHKLTELGEFDKFMNSLEELAKLDYLDADKRYILEELALYGQSVVPLDSF